MSESERMADFGKGFTAIDEARYASYALNDTKLLTDSRDRLRDEVRRSPYYVAPDPREKQARADEARANSAAILAKAGIIVPTREG